MTNKGEVYGVTIRDAVLNKDIANFAFGRGITKTEALKLAAELFFAANNSQRQELFRKLHWKQHRNQGFRRLTSFAEQPRATIPILPDAPATNQAATS